MFVSETHLLPLLSVSHDTAPAIDGRNFKSLFQRTRHPVASRAMIRKPSPLQSPPANATSLKVPVG